MLRQRCIEEDRADELVSIVRGLVGADIATIVDISVDGRRGSRLGYAPGELRVRFDELPYDLHTLMAQHPIHDHLLSTLSIQPARVSEVTGPLQWRRSSARNLLSRYIGARYQLTVPIAVAPGRYTAVNLYRGSRDFTDRDLGIAAYIQPVLIGLHAITPAARAPRRERRRPPMSGNRLTARQLQVLRVMAEGLTTAAIARRLGISPHTAARHVEAVYAALGTHDRASTVLTGYRLGLLDGYDEAIEERRGRFNSGQ